MRVVRRGDLTQDEMKDERKGRQENGMKEGRVERREKRGKYVCTHSEHDTYLLVLCYCKEVER